MLNRGRWLDPPYRALKQQPLRNWQPPGCTLHQYTAKDISTCLHSRRIVLVGDSTVRQVYWAIAKKLDAEGAELELASAEKHGDLKFERAGVDLHFVWDPFINGTRLHAELDAYQTGRVSSDMNGSNKTSRAGLILVGGGLWYARHIEIAHLKYFQESIDEITSYMYPTVTKTLERPSLLSGTTHKPIEEDLLLLAPIQVPLYEALSPSRSVTITPSKIDPMNDYLHELSSRAEILWSYSVMTWKERRAYEASGLHVVDSVATQKADVLLNLRCNTASPRKFPYDRTCCYSYFRPHLMQLIISSSVLVFPLIFISPGKLQYAILVFGLAISYCYYADRTELFNKLQKQFSGGDFSTACWIVAALGLFSLRRSTGSGSATKESPGDFLPDQPLLSRDQSDEWKGWMQFAISIYHYTGASKILWIYEIIRVLVASYLFMTGFGHTMFFITKRDYSLRRCSAVLIRLNLLSCILPYIMRTDYLFYYFAPLVSFWYVVIYCTMRIGKSKNHSVLFLISKIVLSAAVVTALTMTPGVLESLFLFLRYTCRIQWNVVEWRFRVFLDMFVVYVGMIAATLYVKLSIRSGQEGKNHAMLELVKAHFHWIQFISVIVSIGVVPSFWILTRRSPDKYDYNWWQPYISPLPILSYLILRNSNQYFRNYYFSIFAWLGRISLETFTLQFHVWLAADTKGLLSSGFFDNDSVDGRKKDFIPITAIFLWVSWHVADATVIATNWIIDPREGKRTLQNNGSNGRPDTILPRTKSNGFIDQHLCRRNALRLLWKVVNLARDDLRIRLVLMLGTMWALNMVSV